MVSEANSTSTPTSSNFISDLIILGFFQVHRLPASVPDPWPVVRLPSHHHVRDGAAEVRQELLLLAEDG